jgi:signal transduction histidine kinase/DNA-binding NarL/FixJ family response regulator
VNKGLSVVLFVFGFTVSVCSQTPADSLKTALQSATAVEERIDILNELAYALNYTDNEAATQYALEALELAHATGKRHLPGRPYRNLAIIYQNIGHYDTAMAYADSAYAHYESGNDSLGLAAVYNTKGNISYYVSDFTSALAYYERAYDIYSNSGNAAHTATQINNMALVHSEMSNFTEALEKYFEALKLQEKHDDQRGKVLTLRNIGIMYFNLENFDKAIEYYRQSLDIALFFHDDFGIAAAYSNIGNALGRQGKHTEAHPYFEKALDIFEEKNDQNSMAIVYSQIGHYYNVSGDTETGLEFLAKSIAIHEQTGNLLGLAYVLLESSMVQLRHGDPGKSIDDMLRAKDIFMNTGDVRMLAHAYESLGEYYDVMGDYQRALDYFKQHKQIEDSLFSVDEDERIAAAEWRYETEKTRAESARLSEEKLLAELQSQRHRQGRNVFIAASLLILTAGVLLFMRYRVKQRYSQMLTLKNEELSAKRSQIEKQKQKIESQYKELSALDAAKTRFFANISHEFRTPLSLIQGPVDDVLNELENGNLGEASIKKLAMVERNTRQMRELVDQLLDLAKLKAGKQSLKTKRQDIVSYMKQVVNTFDSGIPPDKSISLSLQCDHESVCLYYDREKMDQIINNLLSNAIKSIEKQGKIVISVLVPEDNEMHGATQGQFCKIIVKDTGKGIPEADLPKVFDRFFSADHSGSLNTQGTGIGLELCRELVELHGGHISVESEPGQFSRFIIELPMGKEHLEPHEIVEISGDAEITESASETTAAASSSEGTCFQKTEHKYDYGHVTVLVVEDHDDMRQYIAGHLSSRYNVKEAKNGKQALELICRQQPDLIISDLMMPGMDGMSLLQHIRKSNRTKHIPFVLLTARAGDEDSLLAYELKADAYITKPFKAGELLARVNNLLDAQHWLRDKYSQVVLAFDPENNNLGTARQQFVAQVKETIEQHIGDPDFGIRQLSEKAFLGERQLRRKITEITGLPPLEFIRQIRLLHAKMLIEQHSYHTIAEVAAAVGFNNPTYFSRLFKKRFGMSPHELNISKPG